MNHITNQPVKRSHHTNPETPLPPHLHDPQMSQAIPLRQLSTPPTNVAIPTIPFTCLKGLHENCMRHWWGTTMRGDKDPETEKISHLKGTSRPKGARTPCSHTTRSSTRAGALHPLRNHAPDQGHCTRSEEVHCVRIGCSTPTHKNKRGTGKPSHSRTTPAPNAQNSPGLVPRG